ncbi:hypothetical protein QAD02_023603 [Eretmocerus hayati]|uniref:Uncharacterized protein n=1 Tax=Eretmocerus hayati TaxID=131215 RepID=A0ACC2PX01_9HYME|nr:hypothetical protein QAD02_023603 [Eretmocerus hayati]
MPVRVESISLRKAAEEFRTGKTQVGAILIDKMRSPYDRNSIVDMKNKRTKLEQSRLNAELFEWFGRARQRNIPISGLLLQSKALGIAKMMNIEDFERFRNSNNISFKAIRSKSRSVDNTTVDVWDKSLTNRWASHEPTKITNLNELASSYRALPDINI